MTGNAKLQFARPRAWKLALSADDVNPVELHDEFPGRIDVRAQAEGKGLDKQASFRLALTNLRGTLRNEPVRARGTVQRDGKRWQVSDARLAFGGARATLDGTLRDTIDACCDRCLGSANRQEGADAADHDHGKQHDRGHRQHDLSAQRRAHEAMS